MSLGRAGTILFRNRRSLPILEREHTIRSRRFTLHGLPEEYQTLGLISRKISDTSQVGMFGDIYYPSVEGIVRAREAASASPASLPVAFSSVQRGDVVRLRAHTTGRINRIEQFN